MSDKIDNALGQKVHGRKLENLLDLVNHTESSNHGKTILTIRQVPSPNRVCPYQEEPQHAKFAL